MEKKEMKLSALIETMRGIAAEGNRFVVGDSFHAFGLPCDVVDCDVLYIISNDAKA